MLGFHYVRTPCFAYCLYQNAMQLTMIPHFMHLGQTSSMKTCFSPTKLAFNAGILEDALEVGVGIVRSFYGSIQQQHLENCRCSPTCLLFTNFVEEAILFTQITTH